MRDLSGSFLGVAPEVFKSELAPSTLSSTAASLNPEVYQPTTPVLYADQPTAFDRNGNNLERFKDVCLNAKARI